MTYNESININKYNEWIEKEQNKQKEELEKDLQELENKTTPN